MSKGTGWFGLMSRMAIKECPKWQKNVKKGRPEWVVGWVANGGKYDFK